MAEPKERSHYWQQVGSVLLGAVIAAVTSAVITHMQGRSQLRQTVLQNQLNALKDYSVSFNQEATVLLGDHIMINSTLSDWEQDVEGVTEKDQADLSEKTRHVITSELHLNGTMKAQRVVLYSLFGREPLPLVFAQTSEAYIRTNSLPASDKTLLERIKSFRQNYIQYQGNLAKLIDDENKAIEEMASTIRSEFNH